MSDGLGRIYEIIKIRFFRRGEEEYLGGLDGALQAVEGADALDSVSTSAPDLDAAIVPEADDIFSSAGGTGSASRGKAGVGAAQAGFIYGAELTGEARFAGARAQVSARSI